MAVTTFTVGAVIVHFQWTSGGPDKTTENNVDVYRGTAIFAMQTGAITSALGESEKMPPLRRDIIIRPVDASSGAAVFIDYNGTNPSGVLILQDGTTITAVLTVFHRTIWRNEYIEAEVEFKKVA